LSKTARAARHAFSPELERALCKALSEQVPAPQLPFAVMSYVVFADNPPDSRLRFAKESACEPF
jgi:hypothetical protein